MKHKKKIIATCVSAALVMGCAATILSSHDFVHGDATASDTVTLSTTLKESYVQKEKFTVPSANISVDGSVQSMSHTLIFPDGDKSTAKEVFLTELGEYTLQYTYGDEVVNYNFDVKNGMSSLFSATSNVVIENDVKAPNYFQPSDTNGYGASIDRGVKFTVEEGSSASIYYDNIIDLDELGFSAGQGLQTLDGSFLEWLITPQDTATKEFSRMEVILTDIYDENNFITIEIVAGDYQSSYTDIMYIRSSYANKYEELGWLIGTEKLTSAGLAVVTSFYGVSSNHPDRTARLFFDNANMELWAGVTEYGGVGNYRNMFVMNAYDDPEVVGISNVWDGFTTGEVYLQINVDMIHVPNASFMIFNIGGNDMNKNYETTDNLDIRVDYGSIGAGQYVVAGEGKSFPIFDAMAYSDSTGIVDGIKTNVFYGANKETFVPVVNGRFALEKAGTYTIEYVLDSQFGYVYKEVVINAKADYAAADVLTYTPNEQIPSSAKVGDRIYIPEGRIAGGIGATSCKYSVSYNGEDVALVEGGLVPYFAIEKAGTYTITFTVTDEINGEYVYNLNVEVAEDTVPNITLPNAPKAFITGSRYALPKATANYYHDGALGEVKVSTLVNGVDYTDTLYLVEGDFTITYKAVSVKDASVVATKEVECKTVTSLMGKHYLESYFAVEDSTLETDKASLIVTATGEASKVSFLNKISDVLLNVKFSAYYDANNVYKNNDYTGITVYMTDSINVNEQVKLSVRKDVINGKLYSSLYINDQFSSFIAGSFDGSSRDVFALQYNRNNYSLKDVQNTNVGTIKNFLNGDAFNGFSSEYVYIGIALEEAEVGAQYRITNIGNQSLSSLIESDNGAPTIVYSNKLASYNTSRINESFEIPSAKAYDGLGEVEYVKVTVKTPSGQVIYTGDISESKSVLLDTYGRYVIAYEAKDTNGKIATANYYVFVQEDQAPTITLSEGYVTETVMYKEYTIATANVADDSDYTLVTYAITPEYGQISITDGKIIFEMEGTYKICYYAFDEYYNYSLVSYTVEVSK